MSEARPTIVTVAPLLGTPETGLWCDTCNLPSLVRYPVTAVLPTGVLAMPDLHLCTQHHAVSDVAQAWRETWHERGLVQAWIPNSTSEV